MPYQPREDQDYLHRIEALGGQIYLVPNHKENLIKHVTETFRIARRYRNGGLVHIHVSSGFHAVDGVIARLAGVKFVIYHSHNASFIETKGKRIARLFFKISGTYFLGCTKDAGIFMFGNDVANSSKFQVVKNGVNTENLNSILIKEIILEMNSISQKILICWDLLEDLAMK